LRLQTPPPPAGSFDRVAAMRGRALFKGKAGCDVCHEPPTYTDVGTGATPVLHAPAAVGQDKTYALRSVTKLYRTTPLRALWQHPPYFHDGSAATLMDVVDHYDGLFALNLTAKQGCVKSLSHFRRR
jgi:cytochrome c peroxidase